MSNFLNKIKNWYSWLTPKKISYEKKRVRPIYDWTIILITTIVVMLIMVSFALYFYLQISSGEFFNVTTSDAGNELKINTNLLNKTIDDLKAREVDLNKIKQNKTSPKDPSI
ncbi:MAG: hypothetical protein A3G99_03000 [Candidatus Zambryskibacteria bacterium RIFCSPLOWO2_12_FULL_39_23]|uniref:Uncharacterized protein n=1 Tax=Candidatus Zambryskibacteria bacterium RIFCSPLOWO2_12_FULL_39_23 TaxID=1802776 RepID=A0A1G2URP7_9BACT|nr:MAG: hypothetical protein A2W51_02600 [Candidatus Zambryskibacteria bacterium RIFCSPHIGHO2_02_39_10]OHB12041.1 MAG: hypothetical protein A3G99_03000 [Candidatus Zambryskibacteria bacterium RIFCSPLOWO2_12_FULL_39_23]